MRKYVLGFWMTPGGTVLILKEQHNKYNGIGGKIEVGESAAEAMRREFHEEAGIVTLASEWVHLLTLEGDGYHGIADPWWMAVFMGRGDDLERVRHLPRLHDEGLVTLQPHADRLPLDGTARWLLLMCRDLIENSIRVC